eukprot:1947437-Pyramimonas_sp.AAC.1
MGRTPLHFAAGKAQIGAIKELVELDNIDHKRGRKRNKSQGKMGSPPPDDPKNLPKLLDIKDVDKKTAY